MKSGIAGKVAQAFIDSKLTPLLMIAFLAIGVYGTYLTPREEEPQIDVPMADIFIGYPGASADEVEQRVSVPLEKILSNIEGVEYVYSTSMPDQAMVSARFYVGEDVERSLVRLYNELMKHMDRLPGGVSPPMVKTRSIDDVPMMTLTLWSDNYSDYQIRSVADELGLELKKVTDVAQVKVHGGQVRQVRVQPDKSRLALYGVDLTQIYQTITSSNQELSSGSFNRNDTEYLVDTGNFLRNATDISNLIVTVRNGDPIYLKDLAEVTDGPAEPDTYVEYGIGQNTADESGLSSGRTYPAVTLSFAKRPGTDAMAIAEQIIDKTEALQGKIIPSDLNMTVTRNYGKTAAAKVTSLLEHLMAAIIAVTFVVALSMGWRGGLVVFLSVPVTFALTLFLYYMFGYTLNRITLFALVFVTGIVVDDSIIIAENMHRHFKMKKLPFRQAAIASINEVGNPTILATFTVIAAVLPMAFVSGLMGPYMSPMPIGASLAMIFSLIVALVITPWLAFKLLPHGESKKGKEEKEYRLEDTLIYRAYNKTVRPLIEDVKKRWIFIGGVTFLLLASTLLFAFRMVEVKMLPFDNKNEIQLIVDMPEGTTLERTYSVSKEIANSLKDLPELDDFQIYAGTHAPINFNGLVRHYDLRRGSNIADIQLNLVDKSERDAQSHDIAKRIRPVVQEAGREYGANVKVVEVPPGPPVLSTLVVEVYGPDQEERERVGKEVMNIFNSIDGVVDVDWMVEADQTKYALNVNREKAMQSGIAPAQISNTVTMALHGKQAGRIHDADAVNEVPIMLQLAEEDRSGISDLGQIYMQSRNGSMIPVTDLVNITETNRESSIHRKNQRNVLYVTAEVAGAIESPVYALLDAGDKIEQIEMPEGYSLSQIYSGQPFLEEDYTLKWDGEWQITYEVFRDLGIAFAVVLVIIYMLIIGWFQDFKVPIIMMIAIPLSLAGIILGHWLLGAFFTATSMIGMIALAGIMVRNSVLLIDFIQIRLDEGSDLKNAVIEAGAVRTMPILLTAGTVVIGAFVILFDPIFQGLAISLMGGAIASTALTLLMVPLIYYMVERKNHETEITEEAS
ncbi:efflux RND transporter permease subunit [Balneola sp. MJW-20]|uniref:efflux RND transporter permease subunit n=1 Tax=Gracilimonas aurantiaca TaxID=3234185 RepID=UPI0034668CF2